MSEDDASTPSDVEKVRIRPAERRDLEAFRELRLRALREHPEAFESDHETHRDKGTEFWEDYLDVGGDDAVVVAEDDLGELVGMTGVHLGGSPKSRHRALIWGVYVAPEWRGRGIALRMLEQACEWARSAGATMAHLGVATVNSTAIRLYEQAGFKVYGTEPMRLRVDGIYYDEYLMVKLLDRPAP